MAGVTPDRNRRTGGPAQRRLRETRRKRFLRRRIAAIGLVLAAVVGAYFGLDWLLSRWFGSGKADNANQTGVTTTALTFTPEQLLPVGDLDGDGTQEQVAVGPVESTKRKLALVTGAKAPYKQIGQMYQVPVPKAEVKDLPRASHVLVISGSFPTTGETKKVPLPGGGEGTQAAGGEPFFEAYVADKTKGLVLANYYELAAPVTPPAPTSIVVNKWLNVLWYFQDGKLAMTFRTATGRFLDGPPPSAANQDKNYVTPLGNQFKITNLITNPTYNRLNIKGGDPSNPLGTRFLGFSVYSGDAANVWAIHGTNEPESIGRWVSDGCIRLNNQDVQKLYDQVKSGTLLQITADHP